MPPSLLRFSRFAAGVSLLSTVLLANAGQYSAQRISLPEINGNQTLVITNDGTTITQHGRHNNVQIVNGNNTVTSDGPSIGSISGNANVTVNGKAITAKPARTVIGDGNQVTREYPITGRIDRVALPVAASVAILEGPKAKVTVILDENLQPLLAPRLVGGTLNVLAPGQRFRTEHTPVVMVTLPHLTRLSAVEGGAVHLENLQLGQLDLLASNGTLVQGTGAIHDLRATVSDGAHVDLSEMKTHGAVIIATDGAAFNGNISGDLRVQANDGATVAISGHPRVLGSDSGDGARVTIR